MKIKFSYRVHFSCGMRLEMPLGASEDDFVFQYGFPYSSDGIGRNLFLEAVFQGEIFGKEEALKKIVLDESEVYDHKFLNDDLPEFRSISPTEERIVEMAWESISEKSRELDVLLESLKVEDVGRVCIEKLSGFDQLVVTKQYSLNCVHRHHNPTLSDGENKTLYNKCASIHGHQYILEVAVNGLVNNIWGLACSRLELDKILEREILSKYNATFLNDKLGNTSGELIVEKFSKILEQALGSGRFAGLKVRETMKNSFTLGGWD